MSEHKLSDEARNELKRIFKKRAHRYMSSAARFISAGEYSTYRRTPKTHSKPRAKSK